MNLSLVIEPYFKSIKQRNGFFNQSIGLEKKFLLDLEQGMNDIQRNPLNYQLRHKNVRIKFLEKFDFGIHYIIENKTVFVLAVFHTSQNSSDWI